MVKICDSTMTKFFIACFTSYGLDNFNYNIIIRGLMLLLVINYDFKDMRTL